MDSDLSPDAKECRVRIVWQKHRTTLCTGEARFKSLVVRTGTRHSFYSDEVKFPDANAEERDHATKDHYRIVSTWTDPAHQF